TPAASPVCARLGRTHVAHRFGMDGAGRRVAGSGPAPVRSLTLSGAESTLNITNVSRSGAVAVNKERDILQAAIALFQAKGFHATSMQDLADAVGLQKG